MATREITHPSKPLAVLDTRPLVILNHNLISRRHLQQILGALWLLDGLLQLFPVMWTSYLTRSIMQPATEGQPHLISAALQLLIGFAAQHVVVVNAGIALVQIGLGVFLLSKRGVNQALLASVVWSLMVWVSGEGLGMLLTGKAGAPTGAPGPVLLYAVLALAAYPERVEGGILGLSRRHLRWYLAGFWTLAAILQLQPAWWHAGQLASTIQGNQQPGTLNGTIFDPSLGWFAHIAATSQSVINIAFIVIVLTLAVGMVLVEADHVRPLLAVSIGLSFLMWWATQGFGLILTGSSTDVNSGLLLIVLALACWPMGRTEHGGRRVRDDLVFKEVPIDDNANSHALRESYGRR